MTWIFALAIKSFVLMVLFGLIVWPLARFISRYLPEGRLKRILFYSWEV